MKFISLFLTALLAVAASLPVDNPEINTDGAVRNSAIEQLFLDIIEQFREIMVVGTDDIPVLDPLEISSLRLDLDDIGFPDSYVDVEGTLVNDLSTFVIDNLSVILTSLLQQRYTIVVEGHIPVIEVQTDSYDLDVTAGNIRIFGRGNAKIQIIEPRIKATLQASIGLLGGITFTIRDADVVFELGGIEPAITGIFENDVTEDFVNAFLRYLIPELVVLYQDDISEFINGIIMEIGTIELN